MGDVKNVKNFTGGVMASKKYPNECVRCGFCCMWELCPVAKLLNPFSSPPCLFMSFNGEVATCELAGDIVPIGDGCCILAKAYKDGVQIDFASMPPNMKKMAVKQLLHQQLIRRKKRWMNYYKLIA